MILEIFSQRVKDIRMSRNISQKQLAAEIGLAKSTLSDIESAKGHISFEFAYKVSEYFNVSLDYLTGRSDDSNIH